MFYSSSRLRAALVGAILLVGVAARIGEVYGDSVDRSWPLEDIRLVSPVSPPPAAERHPTPAIAAGDVPVVTAAGEQRSAAIAPDGSGGAIIAWEDRRNGGYDLYAQHVLANGNVDPAWPVDGVVLCANARSSFVHTCVSDGLGGAFVMWEDSTTSIRAQRVVSTGALSWGTCGLLVATSLSVLGPKILNSISDGSGGAYVTWRDNRNYPELDIYASHVTRFGLDQFWPVDGLLVCNAPQTQTAPVLCRGSGPDAIVAWCDLRTTGNGYDIYAMKIRPGGSVDPSWPSNGTAVVAGAGGQRLYSTNNIFWIDSQSSDKQGEAIIPDQAGGCLIAWTDGDTPASQDIYVQHVQSNGAVDPTWPPQGRAVCTAAGPQGLAYLVPNGVGGAIVTWADGRNGVDGDLHQDIYLQHFGTNGVMTGPSDGLAVLTGGTGRFLSQVSDGAPGGFTNGVTVFWTDSRDSSATGTNVYVQHVNTWPTVDTDPAYPANGWPVSTAAGDQTLPSAVWDGGSGAIAAWDDARNFGVTDWDIYCGSSLIAATDVPSSSSAGFALGIGAPNPFRDRMIIDFALPRAASVRLEAFDLNGRRVRTMVSEVRGAGRHQVSWNGTSDQGRSLPAGMYLVSLRADEFRAMRRVVVLR